MRHILAGCALVALAACSMSDNQTLTPDYSLHGQLINTREFGTVISVDQDAHVAAKNLGIGAAAATGNAAGAVAGNAMSTGMLSGLGLGTLFSSAGTTATGISQAPSIGMETALHYVIRKDDGTVVNIDQVPEEGDTIVYPGQRAMLQNNGQFTRVYPADVEHRRGVDN